MQGSGPPAPQSTEYPSSDRSVVQQDSQKGLNPPGIGEDADDIEAVDKDVIDEVVHTLKRRISKSIASTAQDVRRNLGGFVRFLPVCDDAHSPFSHKVANLGI